MRRYRVCKSFVEQWLGEDQDIMPEGHVVLTEDEIMLGRGYFEYWTNKMVEINRRNLISWEACLEDWVLTYWAKEVL